MIRNPSSFFSRWFFFLFFLANSGGMAIVGWTVTGLKGSLNVQLILMEGGVQDANTTDILLGTGNGSFGPSLITWSSSSYSGSSWSLFMNWFMIGFWSAYNPLIFISISIASLWFNLAEDDRLCSLLLLTCLLWIKVVSTNPAILLFLEDSDDDKSRRFVSPKLYSRGGEDGRIFLRWSVDPMSCLIVSESIGIMVRCELHPGQRSVRTRMQHEKKKKKDGDFINGNIFIFWPSGRRRKRFPDVATQIREERNEKKHEMGSSRSHFQIGSSSSSSSLTWCVVFFLFCHVVMILCRIQYASGFWCCRVLLLLLSGWRWEKWERTRKHRTHI